MNATVQPEGPALALVPSNPVPDGARVGMIETTDRIRLRYAVFRAGPAPRGTICLVQGRTEFIEKYFETIADFQARGFAVATFDWRGQGGSQRLIRNRKLGFVERFDDYWTDLASVHRSVLLPDCPPPFYLVGHSMGGLVSLFAATRDRMMFDRVMLLSPMLGVESGRLGLGGTAAVADVLSFIGLGRMPVARAADRAPSKVPFEGNSVTSDRTRYMRSVEVLQARPDLEIGAPTLRWVGAAFRAMAEASRDDFPARVRIPLLILAAARDEIVSTAITEQFGLRMRNGRHLIVPGGKHELLMETDAVRAQVLAAFDAFITEQSG